MRRLREPIRQKHTELWENQLWILHHDNAPAHTLIGVRDFMIKTKTVVIPQLPYSSDLTSADFTFSQIWKHRWKEKILLWERIWKKNRNRSCWRYQKPCFRSVSKIGKNAGLNVLHVREFTLKGTIQFIKLNYKIWKYNL